MHDHDTQNRDTQKSGDAGDGVVDTGGYAGTLLRTAFITVVVSGATLTAMPNPEHDHGGEKRRPVTAAHRRNHKQAKAQSDNGGTHDQRQLGAVPFHQPAGPARKQKQNEQ